MAKGTEVKVKSVRLTKSLKHTIKNTAEDWKFKKDQAKLNKLEKGLAESLHAFFYSVELQEIIQTLPDFMVDSKECKSFRIYSIEDFERLLEEGGYVSTQTWFSNLYFRFEKGVTKPMLGGSLDEQALLRLKKGNKTVYNRLVKVVVSTVRMQDRKTKFKEQLTELLDGVSSTKKLVELFPESVAWIPEVYQCNDLPAADQVAKLLDV